MNLVAIVAAREGSKGTPRKKTKELCGSPHRAVTRNS